MMAKLFQKFQKFWPMAALEKGGGRNARFSDPPSTIFPVPLGAEIDQKLPENQLCKPFSFTIFARDFGKTQKIFLKRKPKNHKNENIKST